LAFVSSGDGAALQPIGVDVNPLKPYPTASSPLGVPVSDRRSALAGIALYAPSRRRSELYRDLSRLAVMVLGPRSLPGSATQWEMPIEADVWLAIDDRIRRCVGEWDMAAVYGRSGGRTGFTLAAISDGRPRAVVRLEHASVGGVAAEARALHAVARAKPTSFVAPTPIEEGEIGAWCYGINEALAMGAHRVPVNPDLAVIGAEVSAALAQTERPLSVPTHWRPAHGDLTPWNLRRRRSGPPALLDWESVTWAPPNADEGLYLISAAAVGRRPRPEAISLEPEVIEYWREAIAERVEIARSAGKAPDALNAEILEVLEMVARGNTG
jgi:hypothetical protein